jgi:hypothetical protein
MCLADIRVNGAAAAERPLRAGMCGMMASRRGCVGEARPARFGWPALVSTTLSIHQPGGAKLGSSGRSPGPRTARTRRPCLPEPDIEVASKPGPLGTRASRGVLCRPDTSPRTPGCRRRRQPLPPRAGLSHRHRALHPSIPDSTAAAGGAGRARYRPADHRSCDELRVRQPKPPEPAVPPLFQDPAIAAAGSAA